MLEYLKGSIAQVGESHVVVEAGGWGIKVTATRGTLEKLKAGEAEIKLPTYLHISENKWEVFGFGDEKEREAFLLLLECRGVGPKAALNILNFFSPARLRRIALGQEPIGTLQQAPGIGAKSADRILVELKEKLPRMSGWDEGGDKASLSAAKYSQDDLYRALKNLGYREAEIHRALSQTPDLADSLSGAVKQLLRNVGKS
jgi:holliday junction DNA helicase RuvA